MSDNLLGPKESFNVSVLNNPFEAKNVQSIHIHFYPIYKNTEWTGTVEFEKGNTGGTQRFTIKELPGLIEKMRSFLEELENNQ